MQAPKHKMQRPLKQMPFSLYISMKKLLLVLPVLATLMLAWCGSTTTPIDSAQEPKQEVVTQTRIIEVKASRFKYEPSEVRVKQWEDVSLKIIDMDTDHGAMFGNMDVYHNPDGTIVLDTSTPGTYEYRCATMCGWWHMDMKWTVIVE